MSNIAYIEILPSDEFQKIDTLAETTLVSGKTYTLQITGGLGLYIQEASEKPTAGGFTVTSGEKFQYTQGSDYLWCKNFTGQSVFLNIAE